MTKEKQFMGLGPVLSCDGKKYVRVKHERTRTVYTMKFDPKENRWFPIDKYRRMFLTVCN